LVCAQIAGLNETTVQSPATVADGKLEFRTASASIGGMLDRLTIGADGLTSLVVSQFLSSMDLGILYEEITLTASSTNSVANLLPANSLILGVLGRVTESITRATTPATGVAIGDTAVGVRFVQSGGMGVTNGSTAIGLRQWRGSVAADANGPTQTAAGQVQINIDGTGAVLTGKVRVVVHYLTFTVPVI